MKDVRLVNDRVRRVQVVCLSGSKTHSSLHAEKLIISIVMKLFSRGRTAIAFEDRARLKAI